MWVTSYFPPLVTVIAFVFDPAYHVCLIILPANDDSLPAFCKQEVTHTCMSNQSLLKKLRRLLSLLDAYGQLQARTKW